MNRTGFLLCDQDGSVFGLNKDTLIGAKGSGGEKL